MLYFHLEYSLIRGVPIAYQVDILLIHEIFYSYIILLRDGMVTAVNRIIPALLQYYSSYDYCPNPVGPGRRPRASRRNFH